MDQLVVKDLTRTFTGPAGDVTVLDGIDLTVARGEFVAVMGQSGSGKSTLLYNVSGMDTPTSGGVLLDGADIAGLTGDELADIRLRRMGFVFQHNHLLKNLTIRDNILLPGYKAGAMDREALLARAEQLMTQMGIADVADHAIQRVSGGQLQRAAVCRALINDPVMLFADEPTGALNSRASAEVIDIFNQVNADGATILMVTHDPRIASRTDRIVYLKDGRVADELTLGTYSDPATARDREETALQWLIDRGF